MKTDKRVQLLEEELKIIKNEIKTILLDLREQCTEAGSKTNTTDDETEVKANSEKQET